MATDATGRDIVEGSVLSYRGRVTAINEDGTVNITLLPPDGIESEFEGTIDGISPDLSLIEPIIVPAETFIPPATGE